MKNSVGIILKRYKIKENKISILDKQLGRIEGICIAHDRPVGSLLKYTTKPYTSGFFFMQTQIIHIPLSLAKIDLLFLHHIFEICYYFAPIGSCIIGIFDLLMFLYQTEQKWKNSLFKKVFLFKLLITLGIYEEYDNICKVCFQYLITTPIDKFKSEFIDLNCKKELHRWLQICIVQHPIAHKFKTMHFLNKV